MNLKDYADIANEMLKEDAPRDNAFRKYDDIYHCKWELPEELDELEWMRNIKDTGPYSAIATGEKILTSTEPRIIFQPLASNTETKEKANAVERNLNWQLSCANSRREEPIETDMAKSALLYAAIVANVVDLDYQISQMELFKGNTKRLKAARRYGRFMVNTFNPKDVHVRRSGLMPEAVLLCQKRKASSILDEWGEYASELEEHKNEDVYYYDFTDYDVHLNWATYQKGKINKRISILPRKFWEHGMPFIPWVAIMGGSTLESEAEHKYKPMFYSIVQSDQWHTSNVALSIAISDALARASFPRFAEEGPIANQNTQIDYLSPERIAKVPAGNALKALPPEPGDQHLWQIVQEVGKMISDQTMSKVLVSGDVPAGTAFASLNLLTQTAIGGLRSPKRLTERALVEMFKIMLLWSFYTKKDIVGYEKDRRVGTGVQYKIAHDEIDPEALYIDVELTPDEPTDRLSRINAANMAINLGYPKEYALEDIGVTDPQRALDQSYMERLLEHRFMMFTEEEKQQLALMTQAKQLEMQQQAQAAQGMETGPTGAPGGMGMAPPQGGMSPAMVNPELTRENATGQDLAGNEVRGLAEMLGR